MRFYLKLALGLALAVFFGHSALAQVVAPQGRLTLVSGTPVLTSDVTGATTIYYTPYVGNAFISPSPTSPVGTTFVESSVALSSTYQTQGYIYDIFGWPGPGSPPVVELCIGPAWPSLTSRGSYGLQLVKGVWENAYSLSGNSGNSTCGAATGYAVYLGSIYITTAGETSVQFTPAAGAGGSGTIIGIWNAYNRVRVTASSQDSNSTWTYSTSSWRNADNSANNSITWLDGGGLGGQTSISAAYDATGSNSSATGQVNVGVGINNLNTPEIYPQVQNSTAILTMHGATLSPPILGLNVAQAIERVASGTETFYGNGQNLLTLETEY